MYFQAFDLLIWISPSIQGLGFPNLNALNISRGFFSVLFRNRSENPNILSLPLLNSRLQVCNSILRQRQDSTLPPSVTPATSPTNIYSTILIFSCHSEVSDRRNPRSGSCSFLVLVLRSRISRFLNDSNKTSNIQQRFGLRALTGHGVVL
ncbi:hypothetical protein L1987_42850 [Smallanthus sonchifolius]|uniref:Uncharacterized protein n=1 Tax=Smallanthus sonchifolius TaxID=185202 RepID=A0ACB9GJS1_9ASTR|nr:hypothetical protein L1987_42850 [Smallanthus sonchifolius]